MPLTLRPTGPVSPAQADRQDGRSTKEGQPIGRIYEDGSKVHLGGRAETVVGLLNTLVRGATSIYPRPMNERMVLGRMVPS